MLEEARRVLAANWRDTYTVPSSHLYPHQWRWDSAFIAIGYARYELNKAKTELLNPLSGEGLGGTISPGLLRC